MARSGSVVVLGSANVDLVLEVDRLPSPGETRLAAGIRRTPGGKGANQAVAAARAGASASFIGAVGADPEAELVRAALRGAGVECMLRTVDHPTGLAVVLLDPVGQNSIVVAAGANASVTDLTGAEQDAVAGADVLLCQLEVPVAAITAAAPHARLLVLNAAPAGAIPDGLWAEIGVLVVNESEAADLTGLADPDKVLAELLQRVPRVIVTLGAAGAAYAERGTAALRVSAPEVSAVDTTAAGDTFCGTLAAGLAAELPLEAALRRAVVAGSLAVQRSGAIDSIPGRAEIDAALRA